MGTVQGRKFSKHDLTPRDEENKKETSSPVKVKESNNKGARTLKNRSQSDGNLVFDNAGSLLSSLHPDHLRHPGHVRKEETVCLPHSRPGLTLSWWPPRSCVWQIQISWTLRLRSSSYKPNEWLPDVIDVEQEDELDARYKETERRGHVETDGRYLQSLERRETIRNIVLPVPSTPNNKSPMISRKAQVCWNKEERKENSPQEECSKISKIIEWRIS